MQADAMKETMVRLTHIGVGRPGRLILDDINLSVEAGHFLGIVGPNGAGKSTLLHVIAGLLKPDAGHVELFGKRLRNANCRHLLARVGFLGQKRGAPPTLPLRVRDVVSMGLAAYHAPLWTPTGHKEEVEKAMALTGIEGLANKDYRSLSGGQQQRVRLARAMAASSRLLLLDEPTAALDPRAQARLYRLLRRLCDEQGAAIIMVEHDIAAISAYVDSVACLNMRIHHHAMRGEMIPENVWRAMYGDHMHVVAHDAHCIGCAGEKNHE